MLMITMNNEWQNGTLNPSKQCTVTVTEQNMGLSHSKAGRKGLRWGSERQTTLYGSSLTRKYYYKSSNKINIRQPSRVNRRPTIDQISLPRVSTRCSQKRFSKDDALRKHSPTNSLRPMYKATGEKKKP